MGSPLVEMYIPLLVDLEAFEPVVRSAGVFLDSYVWIWWRLIGICASER